VDQIDFVVGAVVFSPLLALISQPELGGYCDGSVDYSADSFVYQLFSYVESKKTLVDTFLKN
jgi:hypothetical protein